MPSLCKPLKQLLTMIFIISISLFAMLTVHFLTNRPHARTDLPTISFQEVLRLKKAHRPSVRKKGNGRIESNRKVQAHDSSRSKKEFGQIRSSVCNCPDYEECLENECAETTSDIIFVIASSATRSHLAQATVRNWGDKAKRVLVASDADDPSIPMEKVPGSSDDYGKNVEKFIGGMIMAHKKFEKAYKWMMILDDDSFCEPRVTAKIVRLNGDYTKKQILGQMTCNKGLCGGGGGVLSMHVVDALAEGGFERCRSKIETHMYDVFLSECARDYLGAELKNVAGFHSQPPVHYCSPFGATEVNGKGFLPHGPASFHYINTEKLIDEMHHSVNAYSCHYRHIPDDARLARSKDFRKYSLNDVTVIATSGGPFQNGNIQAMGEWGRIVHTKLVPTNLCSDMWESLSNVDVEDAKWVLVVSSDVFVNARGVLDVINNRKYENELIVASRLVGLNDCSPQAASKDNYTGARVPTLSYTHQRGDEEPVTYNGAAAISMLLSSEAFKKVRSARISDVNLAQLAESLGMHVWVDEGMYEYPPEFYCYPEQWCNEPGGLVETPISFGHIQATRFTKLKMLYECPEDNYFKCSENYWGLHEVPKGGVNRLNTWSYSFK